MADNILSDFGINILEEEIDDVIFQTNEFLTDATFTGSQGPFWWLAKFCPLSSLLIVLNQQLVKSCTMRQNFDGTKPQENKAKTSLFRISLSEYPRSEYKGTNLSRKKRTDEPISLIHNALFHNLVPRQVLQGFRYITSCFTVK